MQLKHFVSVVTYFNMHVLKFTPTQVSIMFTRNWPPFGMRYVLMLLYLY